MAGLSASVDGGLESHRSCSAAFSADGTSVLDLSAAEALTSVSEASCLYLFFNASVGGLASFDHLVGAGEQSWWNVEAERRRAS